MEPARLMSFNVRYDTATDGVHNWAHRRRLVAETVRYHDPDVVGVQEAMTHQLRELESMLPAYEWVGDPRDTAALSGEHTAIGYRRARFTAAATDTFWLSETPEAANSVGWDARHPRVATWARLHEPGADRAMVVLNTHLVHHGERARREGIKVALARLAGLVDDDVVVCCGDFNCVVGDPAHAAASDYPLPDGRHLRDSRRLAPRCHGPTTTRTDFEGLVPDMGIDHVFVSDDVEVTGWSAVTDRDDTHYASDHLPVVVDCLF
jgi:endonuclease/exonuclease/phosphatase family metal-dependent hydrolase